MLIKTAKIKTRLAALGILMAGVFASQAAGAQASAADVLDMSLEQLMNVDVRTAATLTEKNPFKSPSSVTVITAEDIAVTPARNLLDLMEIYVPGAIYMNHSIGPVMGIRGYLVDRPYQYLVTVNGVNVNMKAHYGARLELLNWDMNDIKRVEIIRGPGSVTYGPGAIGGVINIVTKRASDAPGIGVGGFFWDKYDSVGEYISYGHTSPKFDLYAYFSTVSTAGTKPDLFGINGSVAGYVGSPSGPYTDSPTTYMADYRDDSQIKAHVNIDFKNGWRFWARYATESTALFQNNALQYLIDGKYQDYRQMRHRYMVYALENKTKLTDNLDFKSLFSFSSKDTQDIQKYSAAVGAGNTLRNAGWMWSENTFFTRLMMDYHPEDFIKAAAGVEYSYDVIGPAWGKNRNNGLRLGSKYNIISGPNSDAYGTTGSYLVPSSSSGVYYPVGHGWKTASHAVFGETNIQVTDKHSFLLSGRVDKHSYTDYMFSPRAAWIYEFHPKHYLKFVAQRSVRMNTADELYINHQRSMVNQPEKLDSFELMYDGQWNKNFSMKTSLFLNKDTIIAWSGTNSAPLGTLKTYGIEWEGKYKADTFDVGLNHSFVKQRSWHLADGAPLYSGISYAEYVRPVTGNPDINLSNGNDLANWPNQATKLFTNIHFLEKKLTLHGDMRVLWGFEGAKDGLDALEDAGGDMVGINAIRHQDGYEMEITANVSLTYRFNSSADLTFFVQNIPVIGDNKRYSYSSGHNAYNANKTSWIEEPTVVGFRYQIRF